MSIVICYKNKHTKVSGNCLITTGSNSLRIHFWIASSDSKSSNSFDRHGEPTLSSQEYSDTIQVRGRLDSKLNKSSRVSHVKNCDNSPYKWKIVLLIKKISVTAQFTNIFKNLYCVMIIKCWIFDCIFTSQSFQTIWCCAYT